MRLLFSIILILILCNIAYSQIDTLVINAVNFQHSIKVFIYEKGDIKKKPIVYVTDGNKMIENGILLQLSSLSKFGIIPPAYYVFVSTIDEDTGTDHRNDYFFCNDDYFSFFEKELIPTIEKHLNQPFEANDRSLIGVSFGGLNAVYFSAKSEKFQSFGLLSPITYPCKSVLQNIVFSKNEGLKIFISTGKNDAENYVKPLQSMYQSKDYQIKFLQTDGGHDFDNWNGQMAELLSYLLNE